MDEGLVSLGDPKSHQILRVQIETSKPEPPIISFARDYFKVNAKVVAKTKKNQTETKEERRIPKPTSKNSSTRSGLTNEDVFGAPLFSLEEPDEADESSSNEFEAPFKTKFDSPAPGDVEQELGKLKTKSKKRKRAEVETRVKGGKKKVLQKERKTKKPRMVVDDVEDQVLDFELSD